MQQKQDVAVECRGITKRFGSVLANDHIDLTVQYGEILALLGENGSGKTTLMNMLSGIYHPDAGEILVSGTPAHINSPTDAIALGIGMIHQHFKLVEVFSAMDNIVLGTSGKRLPARKLRERILEISGRFGLEVDPDKKIYNMSVSEKQTVEILKVLYRGARILILDEPTAVLTPQETARLFEILRRMREDGSAVIIITHKLGEVLEISDRVTILRKGCTTGTVETAGVDEKELTNLMVGHQVSLAIERPETETGTPVLEVAGLCARRTDGTRGLEDVSLTLHAGEILGVAGIAGSGQKELCEALTGLLRVDAGRIDYEGIDITGKSPAALNGMGARIGFVPEDRLGMGLVGSMGMSGNMLLRGYRSGKGPFIDRAPARALAQSLIGKLEVSTPGTETPVRMLSGGNVQKVLLGREIEANPKALIVAYPVRGLDINSSHTVYSLLNAHKQKGGGVLFVGEDLDVMLELCDRILVLCHGQVSGVVDARTASKEQIGLLMMGQREAGREGQPDA